MKLIKIFVFLSFLFAAAPSYADCSNPSGVSGHQMYNKNYNVMQYCNGTRWIAMSAETSGVWIQSGANIYYETGRVGIGLNNPSVELDVSGSATVSNNFKVSSLISGLIVADETGLFRKETVVPAVNFPALTGAITTTSGSLATVLSDNAVTTAKLADTAVTEAKIADNAVELGADTIGNYVAGVTAGAGITVTGTPAEGWSPTITSSGDATPDTIGDNGTITLSTTGSEVTGILPVANGGTGSSAFTTGSIPFFNGTLLTENNAGLFWDNANSRLGLGTIAPANKLDVAGIAEVDYLRVDPQDGTNEGGELQLMGAGSYGILQFDNFQGNARIHSFANGKVLHLLNGAIETTSTTANNYFMGNVGVGVAAPTQKLHVVGNVRIQDGTQGAGKVLTSAADGTSSWQNNLCVGVGQTWQNVTASRATGTNYTNTTGKPIMVAISANGDGQNRYLYIDGIAFRTHQYTGSYYHSSTTTMIVPNGSTYSFTGSISTWAELR